MFVLQRKGQFETERYTIKCSADQRHSDHKVAFLNAWIKTRLTQKLQNNINTHITDFTPLCSRGKIK